MKSSNNTMHFNVSGSDRKTLVGIISGQLETTAKYLGAPSFQYQVDDIIIGSQGEVAFGSTTRAKVKAIVNALVERGFQAEEPVEQPSAKAAKKPKAKKDTAPAENGEKVSLTVAVPADKVNMENLVRLLEAKDALIKKALGIEATFVKAEDGTVKFDWFEGGEYTPAEVHAYTQFIGALCEMSVTQTRVTAKDKPVDNEKYAFRCFLLRLGFIGDEYKADRKILLKNLSGSAAFKAGSRKGAEA